MVPCLCITFVIVPVVLIIITPRRLGSYLIRIVHHVVQREGLSTGLKIEKLPCFSVCIGVANVRRQLFRLLADTRMIEVEFTIVVGLAVQDVVEILCHVHIGNVTIDLRRVILLVQRNIVQVEVCAVVVFFARVEDLVFAVLLLINIIDIFRHLRGVLAVVIVQRVVLVFVQERAILQHPEPRLHVGRNSRKVLFVFGRAFLQLGVLCTAERSGPAVIFGQIVKVLSVRAETHHAVIIEFRLGSADICQTALFQVGQQLITLVLQHHNSVLAGAAFSSEQKKTACKQDNKNDCNYSDQFNAGLFPGRSPHIRAYSLCLCRARWHRHFRGSFDDILGHILRSCQPRTATAAEFCTIRKRYSTFRANHTQFLHVLSTT